MKLQTTHLPSHQRAFLLADSGATKTTWAYVKRDMPIEKWQTQGLNPAVMPKSLILERLQSTLGGRDIEWEQCSIFFYGAGCHADNQENVKAWIEELYSCPTHVESDMMGAARALLQHDEGIAAILGTGSNSCHYDGKTIVRQTPSLGFILGDEGSGAVLSKLFIADLLKGRVAPALRDEFLETCKMNIFDLIQHIYREPAPNAFLASWVPWIADRRSHPDIAILIHDNFSAFVDRCLSPYSMSHSEVHFVGSIASVFESELREVFRQKGYSVGQIVRSPLDGLIDFHRSI